MKLIREYKLYLISFGLALLTLATLLFIVELIKEPKYIKQVKNSLYRPYDACRIGLSEICNRHFPKSAIKTIAVGTAVDFANEKQSRPYKLFGWYQTENQGTWSNGNSAVIRFRLKENSMEANTKLVARIHFRIYHPSDKSINIRVNDISAMALDLRRGSFDIPLPKRGKDFDGNIQIKFEINNARSPADYGASADGRKIAIYLQKMQIVKEL